MPIAYIHFCIAGLQESSPEEPEMHQNSWQPDPTGEFTPLQRLLAGGEGAYRPIHKNPTPGSASRPRFAPRCWFRSDAIRYCSPGTCIVKHSNQHLTFYSFSETMMDKAKQLDCIFADCQDIWNHQVIQQHCHSPHSVCIKTNCCDHRCQRTKH